MESNDKICEFKQYLKQTMDLLVDAYKWRIMSEECDNMDMRNKYIQVSNTLYEMFMIEHNSIGNIFKGE